MIDLDERLHRASTAVRSEVSHIQVRPPSEVFRRQRRSRAIGVASGLTAIAVVVFGSSFIFSGGGVEPAGRPADPVPAHSYTVDLPGWDLVAVWEAEDGSGRSHTLFNPEESTAGTFRRVKVDTGSAATDRGETLQERGVQPVESVPLSGSVATLYRTQSDAELGWATLIALWTGPQGEQVAVLFEGVGVEDAKNLLTGLTPLDLQGWQSLTSSYEPPVSTTTSR